MCPNMNCRRPGRCWLRVNVKGPSCGALATPLSPSCFQIVKSQICSESAIVIFASSSPPSNDSIEGKYTHEDSCGVPQDAWAPNRVRLFLSLPRAIGMQLNKSVHRDVTTVSASSLR